MADEMYEQNGHVGSIAQYYRQNKAALRRQVTTDDADLPDDDVLYDTRSPSSVRRYHAPTHTEIRVTRHQGAPPRRTHKEQQTQRPQVRPHRRRSPRFYVG